MVDQQRRIRVLSLADQVRVWEKRASSAKCYSRPFQEREDRNIYSTASNRRAQRGSGLPRALLFGFQVKGLVPEISGFPCLSASGLGSGVSLFTICYLRMLRQI
jgi:hypothetical protein